MDPGHIGHGSRANRVAFLGIVAILFRSDLGVGMRKTHSCKIILLAALCCAFSTACSSGGGGGSSQSVAIGSSAPAPIITPPADYTDTGIAGTVAAPPAATFGTAPPQLATSGGPTLDNSSGSYPSPNVSFPLITTALQKTSTGLSPAPGDPAATLTILSPSSNNYTSVRLTVPSLGISQSFFFGANLGTPDPEDDAIYGLSYVATAGWGLNNTPTNPPSTGVYVFGFETPQAAMPTSGTAVFSGQGLVSATVYKPVGTDIQVSNPIEGNASISANFGSGAVTGSFTKMQTLFDNKPWNDVTLNANIATGANRFSGTTAVASAPGTPMSLSGSATGSISGAFYGPAAQNLGAVWSLSDGTGSALGTVVAGH